VHHARAHEAETRFFIDNLFDLVIKEVEGGKMMINKPSENNRSASESLIVSCVLSTTKFQNTTVPLRTQDCQNRKQERRDE